MAAPCSIAFCLSGSLAMMVGLRTLGSRFASSCGICRTGNGGSVGGAFDPAGVVENKLCSRSFALSARFDMAP